MLGRLDEGPANALVGVLFGRIGDGDCSLLRLDDG